jgi:hypothetical protein
LTSTIMFSSSMSSFFLLLLSRVGVHCGIYKGSYHVSTISYLNSPFHQAPLFPSLPIHGTVWTGIITACMYLYFLHRIHSPTPFPHHLPLLLVPTFHPRQDMLYPSVLWFCRREKIKRKTLHFCLR